MSHKVFIRHTYIYKCSARDCNGEWKINEAEELDKLSCPHCGKNDVVDYVREDQRTNHKNRWE